MAPIPSRKSTDWPDTPVEWPDTTAVEDLIRLLNPTQCPGLKSVAFKALRRELNEERMLETTKPLTWTWVFYSLKEAFESYRSALDRIQLLKDTVDSGSYLSAEKAR